MGPEKEGYPGGERETEAKMQDDGRQSKNKPCWGGRGITVTEENESQRSHAIKDRNVVKEDSKYGNYVTEQRMQEQVYSDVFI